MDCLREQHTVAELKAEMEERVKELALSPSVRFLGFRSDIARVTSTYDVAVIPSIWDELFGWTVIEAMACGKPVIASRSGGIPEIITDGKTGILVEPGDSEALAHAVLRVCADPELRRSLSVAATRRVGECFTEERMLAETYRVYAGLFRSPTPTKE